MRISDWSSDVCSSDLDPGIAGIEAANGQPLVTQQLLAKAGKVDAQVRALDEVGRKTGQFAHPLGDRVALLGTDGLPFGKGGGIGAPGKMPRGRDGFFHRRRPVRQLVTVSGAAGIAWQIGQVDLVETQLTDSIVQERVEKEDAVQGDAAVLQGKGASNR